jgi:hypothetical protein
MNPHRQTLDDDSASRMLQGLVHPDDAPPGYASVAGLLASAAQFPPLPEDAGTTTICAMVEEIRAGAAPTPENSRRRSMLGKLFAGKALVAMATVALTASGAAAATGSLPAPVQDAVSKAVSHVGVDLPADAGRSADHRQDADHRQSGDKGQSGDDHGQPGDDAGDNGKGAEISDLTHDPALDGQPKGPTVSDFASNGKSQAGEEHGKAAGDTTTDGSDDDAGEHTPPVTPGSKATGEEHSDRDLGPADHGKASRRVG